MMTEQPWRGSCLLLYPCNLIVEIGGAKMKESADRYHTCLSYVPVADELVIVAESSGWTFVVSIVPTYLPTYVWLGDFWGWWWSVGGGSWDMPCSACGLC